MQGRVLGELQQATCVVDEFFIPRSIYCFGNLSDTDIDGANNGVVVHGEALGTWCGRFFVARKCQPSFNKGSKSACGCSNGLWHHLFWTCFALAAGRVSQRRPSDGQSTSFGAAARSDCAKLHGDVAATARRRPSDVLRCFCGISRLRWRRAMKAVDLASRAVNLTGWQRPQRILGTRNHFEIRIEPDGNRFLDSYLFSGSYPQQYRHLTEI